jgi:tetratricopeptide (TPR) repeat protein
MATETSAAVGDRWAGELASRAVALVTRNEHAEALALLEASLAEAAGPVPVAVTLARGRALVGLERFRAASELLYPLTRDAAEVAPLDRAHARRLYVRCMLRQGGDLDVLIDMAREAARIAEKHGAAGVDTLVFARGDAALAFARKRARKCAERELDAAGAIVGSDARLWAFRGALLIDFDERSEARAAYRECAGLPDGGDRLARLGEANLARLGGDFAAAHLALDAVGAVGGSDLAPRWERARLFVSAKRWHEAAAAYERLLEASPRSDYTHFVRGERATALFHAGDREAAVAAWRSLAGEPVEDRMTQSARRVLSRLEDPAKRGAKKRRLDGFRTVTQLRDHCGPACCELYLGFFGLPGDQVEIARQIKLANQGTPVYAMRRFLETAGLEVRRVEATLDVLRAVLDLGLPLILEEEYSTTRHVAVAVGYDDEREVLEVQDPMTHEVRETPYEALPRLLAFANHGAILAYPKSDSARAAALDAAGVREAEYIRRIDDAWLAHDEQRYDDAGRLVDEGLGLREDYELAWMCRWALAQKLSDEAERAARLESILENILRLWPDDEWPQQYVGYHRYHAGRYEEALRAFEKARDRDDADGNNWAMIGDCLVAMGRTDGAVDALVEALRRLPFHARATENLADLLEQRGRFGQAWALNDCARELGPGNPFNFEVAARLHERRANLAGALAMYDAALVAAPDRAWAKKRRARVLAELGRVDDAVGALRALIAEHEGDVGTTIELADLLYGHGRSDEAAQVCEELLGRDPTNASAQAIYGASIAAAGRLDEGLVSMRKALATWPSYAWVYSEMGKHLMAAGRTLEGVEACAAASGFNRSANNEFFLADALFRFGAKSDAAGKARSASPLGALSRDKLVRCAEILAAAESLGSARDFLDETSRARPEDPAPLAAQCHLLLEMAWAPHAAAPLLARIAEWNPEDPYALVHRGQQALASGAGGEAEGEQLLRAAVERLPGRRAPLAFLAEALVARQRHEEVLTLLASAPPVLTFQRSRVLALLGLGRAQEAFEVADDHEIKASERAEGWELKYLVAKQVGEWGPALEFVEKLCHAGSEEEDDGELGRWEIEKVRCLLALGERERALSFGEKQISDAASAAVLAKVALDANQPDVAQRFTARVAEST